MISFADLRPKSQRTYVRHTELLLLHISFVSRGFMPVNSDLNLCIHPELLRVVFCIVIYYNDKGYIARIYWLNDLPYVSSFIFL